MKKRYVVSLAERERAALRQRISAGRDRARELLHATERLLDEVVAATSYGRKRAILLLRPGPPWPGAGTLTGMTC
jgi:hypothetical protein